MSCAMSFGELNIPSSRAFWDDCDEDEPSEPTGEKLELKYVEGVESEAIPCDLLLLIEGTAIADFAQTALLNNLNDSRKICDIPSKRSSLHHLVTEGHSTLLAVLEENLVSSGEVATLLEPYAKLAQQVVTVTIKPKADFKSENIAKVRDEIVFWRGINPHFKHIKPLEPPNFIAGVAAGIASYRDIENLAVSSYVAYVDNVALDALVSKPVLQLLQKIGLKCASSYTPKPKDDSHLYS